MRKTLTDMNNSLSNKQIKSKERVQKHGEVFTPSWVVSDMLNMLPDEVWKLETKFLEPTCGEGAFLLEILRRKLQKITAKSQEEWEWEAAIATSSLYGIELLEDNAQRCRINLVQLFNDFYKKQYPDTQDTAFLETIRFFIERNVIQGNALTYRKCTIACGNECNTCEEIVFSEWNPVSINNYEIIRKDFTYKGIIHTDKMKKSAVGGLFEEEFLNEEHGLIKEYIPIHFKKIQYAEN